MVTERKKLASRRCLDLSRKGCKKGEYMAKAEGVTTALWAGFGEKEWFAGVCSAKASKFETWFGPQGAIKNELSSLSRDSIEATKAGNGTPKVAPSATGNPHLCPQPRRGRKRAVGIRHSIEHFSRRNAGRGAPLLAAVSAGFAGNSQRTVSFGKFLPQGFSNLACPNGARNTRGRLPPSGP